MAEEMICCQDTTDFALNLFREVTQANSSAPKRENVFFSPTSITVALAMAQKGADGETKRQMFQALFGEKADENLVDKCLGQWCDFLSGQQTTQGNTLDMANRLFCDGAYPFLDDYLTLVRHLFKADAQNLNFATQNQESVAAINGWVSDKTRGKIAKLFERLSTDTKMVIVNAIYFKGDWKTPFSEERTQKDDFHVNASETKQLDFMNLKDKFEIGGDNSAQVLSMPYVNENLSMVFVLPRERFGLEQLEKSLTAAQLWSWIDNTRKSTVIVSIPKFKLETSLALKETLQKLGMTDMFSGNADFSRMSAKGDLSVSDVVHKAFLEVNEKGAEAAATTAILLVECCAMITEPVPERFFADRPFLLLIVEKFTKSTLFLGHFYAE